MSGLLRNIIRFFLFILLQVYLLNKIPPLHQYINPYIYYLFILWLPFNISRANLMFIGFFTGIVLDYFMMTPGIHAAPCVLIAYLRPFVIGILTPKEASEFNYREPSPKAMGWTPYLVYTLILTLFHHGYMVLLEWLSFGSILHFIIKVIATTGISMLLIITTELLFPRKMRFRTNTA
ncbi:MAG: rod shape-determining protein MreD [Bacteroidota bacterium]|nr:rod shape-determining protein MreD [Bacteroidota bacterium]